VITQLCRGLDRARPTDCRSQERMSIKFERVLVATDFSRAGQCAVAVGPNRRGTRTRNCELTTSLLRNAGWADYGVSTRRPAKLSNGTLRPSSKEVATGADPQTTIELSTGVLSGTAARSIADAARTRTRSSLVRAVSAMQPGSKFSAALQRNCRRPREFRYCSSAGGERTRIRASLAPSTFRHVHASCSSGRTSRPRRNICLSRLRRSPRVSRRMSRRERHRRV
jgi:hypothetical protein